MKLTSSNKTQKMISLVPTCFSNRLRSRVFILEQSAKIGSRGTSSHLRMSKQEKEKVRKRYSSRNEKQESFNKFWYLQVACKKNTWPLAIVKEIIKEKKG